MIANDIKCIYIKCICPRYYKKCACIAFFFRETSENREISHSSRKSTNYSLQFEVFQKLRVDLVRC